MGNFSSNDRIQAYIRVLKVSLEISRNKCTKIVGLIPKENKWNTKKFWKWGCIL